MWKIKIWTARASPRFAYKYILWTRACWEDRWYRYDNWWPRSCLDKVQISRHARNSSITLVSFCPKFPIPNKIPSDHSREETRSYRQRIQKKKKKKKFLQICYTRYTYYKHYQPTECVINKEFVMRIINGRFSDDLAIQFYSRSEKNLWKFPESKKCLKVKLAFAKL